MQKDEVISVLREMADLLEITDANKFEIMALRNGAQGLEDWLGDLAKATSDATLTEIPSVGKGISQVVADLVNSGTSEELNRVRGLVPEQLPLLLRFRGLGPKRVRALWQELNIESTDDLKRAADEGRVQSLRGFGAKTVEKILSSLDYFQNAPARTAASTSTKIDALPKAEAATGKILAGTSGYSFPQWKGSFYPADARTDDLLQHYANRLATVEINNTFYRFPSQKVVEQWKTQTPDNFQFALKAHRRITHQLRLGPSAKERILEFVERCGQLGNRLGCILFQLPPDFARDDSRLDMLLDALPSGPRYAIEFRHNSWFDDEVESKLRKQNIACVSGDAENEPPRKVVTADFIYARLRKGAYTESELAEWNGWFTKQQADHRDVLVYLKHDEAGVAPQSLLHW